MSLFVQTHAFSYHRFNDPTKKIVRDETEFWNLIGYLLRFPIVSYDCETSGTAWFRHARICGVSFSVWNPQGPGTLSWYIPCRHQTGERQLHPDIVMAGVRRILEAPHITKICHNRKFELHMAANEGIQFVGPCRDTMIEAHLYNENAPIGLKERAQIDLQDSAPRAHELILDGVLKERAKEARLGIKEYKDRVGYAQVPIDLLGQYACYDSHAALLLASFYDSKNVRQFFSSTYDTEIQLSEALFQMERNGLPIDVAYLNSLKERTAAVMATVAPQVFSALGGYTFNLGSDDELRDVLTRRLGLRLWKQTDGGKLAVDKEVLEHFADDHPACSLILEWRQASKINSTYTDSILDRLDADGILHGDVKQIGTNTGRTSSEKPNLQNFAGDSDKRALAFSGKKLEDGGVDPLSVKRGFKNRAEGWRRCYFDYSQIELRVLAEYSGDPTMIDVYLRREDIHKRTQMEVFNDPGKERRRHAKVINFGLSYCMSAAGFARQAKIPPHEAEAFMKVFFQKYPRIGPFREEFWAMCRKQGNQFHNLFGRPRRIPQLTNEEGWIRGRAERQAIGSLIQGTAAELTKISIVRIHNWEKQARSGLKLCSTIHDEISLDVRSEISLDVAREVKHMMEGFQNVFQKVPIETDAEYSDTNWAEKKPLFPKDKAA